MRRGSLNLASELPALLASRSAESEALDCHPRLASGAGPARRCRPCHCPATRSASRWWSVPGSCSGRGRSGSSPSKSAPGRSGSRSSSGSWPVDASGPRRGLGVARGMSWGPASRHAAPGLVPPTGGGEFVRSPRLAPWNAIRGDSGASRSRREPQGRAQSSRRPEAPRRLPPQCAQDGGERIPRPRRPPRWFLAPRAVPYPFRLNAGENALLNG
jgi:hypothetical protein